MADCTMIVERGRTLQGYLLYLFILVLNLLLPWFLSRAVYLGYLLVRFYVLMFLSLSHLLSGNKRNSIM